MASECVLIEICEGDLNVLTTQDARDIGSEMGNA